MEQDAVKEYGMVMNEGILTLSIIGEIEGHDCLSQNAKTTKYEHILPILARAEQDENVKGILFLMNTVGGDVSCGLALAEMVHSLSTVSYTHLDVYKRQDSYCILYVLFYWQAPFH